jgi:hypothetical protein
VFPQGNLQAPPLLVGKDVGYYGGGGLLLVILALQALAHSTRRSPAYAVYVQYTEFVFLKNC